MAERLVERIEQALNEFETLSITTNLKDATGNELLLETAIHLLTGDITTTLPKEVFAPDNQSILKYHIGREQQGYEIIKQNIQTLKDLLKMLREELQP